MLADPDLDPEALQVMSAAQELSGLLHRYIAVHDRIFKFSLRHILPIPGLFKPINFQQHFESLHLVELDLQRLLESIGRSPLARTEAGERLLAYGAALSAAVAQLREICRNLLEKGDGTRQYRSLEYQRDLDVYQERVAQYQKLGIQVNALFRR